MVEMEETMRGRALVVGALGLLLVNAGLAKSKKVLLPAYVLQAKTVAVLVDPEAGISVEDPRANQVAQKDVETALLKWGRFEPVLSTRAADIIIVLRRGNGRLVNQTIIDSRQNDRAGVINPTDDGIGIGAQRGRPPYGTAGAASPSGQPQDSSPRVQTEVGTTSEDSFVVLEGNKERPLDSPPAWRYIAKDGLRPHSVPAVEEFRKAIVEAEKAASKNP